MGFGMAVLGISYNDLCRMTPEEYRQCCVSWREVEESRQRQEWERTRTLATICIQPYCKKGKKIQPHSLLPFPWDNERKDNKPKLSRAERKARFDKIMKNLEK